MSKKKNHRSFRTLGLAGVASLYLLLPVAAQAAFGPSSAQLNETLDEEGKRRSEFDFTVHCDPFYAEGYGESSDFASRSTKTPRFGLRPPRCVLKADQKGGSFECECVDGKKSKGIISAKEALEMHTDKIDSFDWCEDKVKEVCDIQTPTLSSVCESEHGICAITAYGRKAGKEYTDLEQECHCEDENTWLASTPTNSNFELDQATLDNSCQAELAHCAPSQIEKRASEAIELQDEILSYPKGMGCMNENGMCQVYAYKDKFRTNCECYAFPDEGFGLEGPDVLGGLQDMLALCREEVATCPPDDTPEPEEDPEDDCEDESDGTHEPSPGSEAESGEGEEGAGELPDPEKVQPGAKVLPIGCSLTKRGFGGFWGLLAFPALCLWRRRRRSSK